MACWTIERQWPHFITRVASTGCGRWCPLEWMTTRRRLPLRFTLSRFTALPPWGVAAAGLRAAGGVFVGRGGRDRSWWRGVVGVQAGPGRRGGPCSGRRGRRRWGAGGHGAGGGGGLKDFGQLVGDGQVLDVAGFLLRDAKDAALGVVVDGSEHAYFGLAEGEREGEGEPDALPGNGVGGEAGQVVGGGDALAWSWPWEARDGLNEAGDAGGGLQLAEDSAEGVAGGGGRVPGEGLVPG